MTNKQAAIKIVKILTDNGFVALFAGGCVRDMLLERPAKDYDVATDAQPNQVTSLFGRTLQIGAQFGVIMVSLGNCQVEVATFRTESGYSDGRHPNSVKFSTPKEDASRRDFTINGMFYNPFDEQIIDYVNGQGDLKSGIIRTIGIAKDRFDEDHLRMLRAVRFSADLGFEIEPLTYQAIIEFSAMITKISSERIANELSQILICPNRSIGIDKFFQSGLGISIFPAMSKEAIKTGVGILAKLRKTVSFPLAFAAMFSGSDTKQALIYCKQLKLSNEQCRHIKFLLDNRSALLDSDMSLADLKTFLASEYFDDLFQLEKAVQKVLANSAKSLTQLKNRIKELGDVQLQPDPLLNGHQLMDLGVPEGAILGRLMKDLYTAQLNGLIETAEQAQKWAKKWLKSN